MNKRNKKKVIKTQETNRILKENGRLAVKQNLN